MNTMVEKMTLLIDHLLITLKQNNYFELIQELNIYENINVKLLNEKINQIN